MNIKSLTRWLVMTEFEMLLNVVGILIFSILISIKLDFNDNITWKEVFAPLFIADGLQAYFCVIVFIRQLSESETKDAVFRYIISFLLLASRVSFKLLTFFVVTGPNGNEKNFKFQYVAIPLFFHLSLLMLRSCRLKKYQVFS